MHPSILCDAFRKSGVYPLRREQITDIQTRSSLIYSSSSATVAWKVLESSNHDARQARVPEETTSSVRSDQTVSYDAPLLTPLAQENAQTVSLDANPIPNIGTK